MPKKDFKVRGFPEPTPELHPTTSNVLVSLNETFARQLLSKPRDSIYKELPILTERDKELLRKIKKRKELRLRHSRESRLAANSIELKFD